MYLLGLFLAYEWLENLLAKFRPFSEVLFYKRQR